MCSKNKRHGAPVASVLGVFKPRLFSLGCTLEQALYSYRAGKLLGHPDKNVRGGEGCEGEEIAMD